MELYQLLAAPARVFDRIYRSIVGNEPRGLAQSDDRAGDRPVAPQEFDLIEEIFKRQGEPVIVFEGATLVHAVAAIREWVTSPQYGPVGNGITERLNRAVRIRAVREETDHGAAEGWAIGRAWYVDTAADHDLDRFHDDGGPVPPEADA